MSRKPTLGTHILEANRKIARCLHKGEPVPPALAKNLADLLAKEQRNRFGQLQNARRRGELHP
jgi:hypothetical protein